MTSIPIETQLKTAHNWLTKEPQTNNINNYTLWKDNKHLVRGTPHCYSTLSSLTKTPDILAFQFKNPDGKNQEFFDAIFDPKTSPWRDFLSGIQQHQNTLGHTIGAVCFNKPFAQGWINFLIACRTVYEFQFIKAWQALKTEDLGPWDAYFLVLQINTPESFNPNNITIRSYISNHSPLTLGNKTHLINFLSGKYNQQNLRDKALSPSFRIAPCNNMWDNNNNESATQWFTYLTKNLPQPINTPSLSFSSNPLTQYITLKELVSIYKSFKDTL